MQRFIDSWHSTLTKLGRKKLLSRKRPASRYSNGTYSRRSGFEHLEDRRLLAGLVLLDSDAYAAAQANSNGAFDQDGGIGGEESAQADSTGSLTTQYGTQSSGAHADAGVVQAGDVVPLGPRPPWAPVGQGALVVANGTQSATLYEDATFGGNVGASGYGEGEVYGEFELDDPVGMYDYMEVRFSFYGRWWHDGEWDEEHAFPTADFGYIGHAEFEQIRPGIGQISDGFVEIRFSEGGFGRLGEPPNMVEVIEETSGLPGGTSSYYNNYHEEPQYLFGYQYKFWVPIQDGDVLVFDASTDPYHFIAGSSGLAHGNEDGGGTITGGWIGAVSATGILPLPGGQEVAPPDPIPGDTTPPKVLDLTISGSNALNEPYSFHGENNDHVGSGALQLAPVPVVGADTISITFSENVYLAQGDLTLVGSDTENLPVVTDFILDGDTATWVFEEPFATDEYQIFLDDFVSDANLNWLDGDWDNPVSLTDETSDSFPSGNGVAGGDFLFDFTIDAEAAPIVVSTLVDELDMDYSFGDLSLREALAIAAGFDGLNTIEFASELWGGDPIELSLGQLVIDSNVEILGPGQDLLSIDATNASRVFYVNQGVVATISGLAIAGGSASVPGSHLTASGGGLYVEGDLTLDSVLVAGNKSVAEGAGIFITSDGSLSLITSTIDGNEAGTQGAGIMSRALGSDKLYIYGSTISNNTSVGSGGGLMFFPFQSGATGLIVNSTFSGNTGQFGGGIMARYAATDLTIINSTITDNYATADGGGIFLTSGAEVTLHNSIVAGNEDFGNNLYNDIRITSNAFFDSDSSHNLIGVQGGSGLVDGTKGNLVGNTSTPLNPGLTALGDHGGPTKTHALLAGSLAIDAGDDSIAEALLLLLDQRGENRYADGDDDEFTIIDIGAFELAADEYFGSV